MLADELRSNSRNAGLHNLLTISCLNLRNGRRNTKSCIKDCAIWRVAINEKNSTADCNKELSDLSYCEE